MRSGNISKGDAYDNQWEDQQQTPLPTSNKVPTSNIVASTSSPYSYISLFHQKGMQQMTHEPILQARQKEVQDIATEEDHKKIATTTPNRQSSTDDAITDETTPVEEYKKTSNPEATIVDVMTMDVSTPTTITDTKISATDPLGAGGAP